jgi:hypothetical protein
MLPLAPTAAPVGPTSILPEDTLVCAPVNERRLLFDGNAVDDLTAAFEETVSDLDPSIAIDQKPSHFLEGIGAFNLNARILQHALTCGGWKGLHEIGETLNLVICHRELLGTKPKNSNNENHLRAFHL